MAPIRRYLRITKYSVLECRIYLDNPALAHSWLLNPRKPVLPRVIEAVRPLVLPKLREERERSRKKSTKKKGIKDVVTEDDFEVSIFLTETSTRHSLLTKHKHFHDKTQTKLTSNSGKLVGAASEAPIDVDEYMPTIGREESDEEALDLEGIPTLPESAQLRGAKRSRRQRRAQVAVEIASEEDDDDGSEDGLFVEDDDQGEEDNEEPPSKRIKDSSASENVDDKKKLAMDISYEGFSIYGRVLCLVVQRRDVRTTSSNRANSTGGSSLGNSGSAAGRAKAALGTGAGQAMMENWISSTQMPAVMEDVQ